MTAAPPILGFTKHRLDANDPDSRFWIWGPTRDDLRELIQRHRQRDIENRGLVWIEYDVLDCPLLRFGYMDLDSEGRAHLARDGRSVAMLPPVEVALVGDLPAWWAPR